MLRLQDFRYDLQVLSLWQFVAIAEQDKQGYQLEFDRNIYIFFFFTSSEVKTQLIFGSSGIRNHFFHSINQLCWNKAYESAKYSQALLHLPFRCSLFDELASTNKIIAMFTMIFFIYCRDKLRRITKLSKRVNLQKQPSRGALKRRCSEIMQHIYRRTHIPKCDFNKAAKQLY